MTLKHWLLGGLLSLVILLLILLSIGSYLAYTQQGARWLFGLAQHFAPGELQAQQINGRLAGALDIQGLDYRQGDLHLASQQLRLSWHPAKLLQRELHISELVLQGTRLTLPMNEDTEPGQAATFNGLVLPIAVRLVSAQINDFQIIPPTGQAQTLEQLTLAAYTEGKHIHIENLRAKGFGADVGLQGQLGLAAELPLDIQLNWHRLRWPLQGDAVQIRSPQGQAKVRGQRDNYQFNLAMDAEIPAVVPVDAVAKPFQPILFNLQGNGHIDLNDENLRIQMLELSTGDNQVQISGSLGQAFDLNWRLNAPKLAQLWPGLAGALQGQGALLGTLQTLQIQAQLAGEDLVYQQNHLAKLDLKAQVGAQAGQPLLLDLDAQDLTIGNLQWQALKLQTQGTRAQHQMALQLEAGGKQAQPIPQGTMRLSGGLDNNNRWHGQLQDLQLQLASLAELGDWRLQDATALELGTQQQRLEKLCLANQVNPSAHLCARFQSKVQSGWQANLSVPRFPLELLQTWLPGSAKINGNSSLQADFRADTKGRIQGQAELNLPRGHLQLEVADKKQRLDFSGGQAKAVLNTQGADLQLQLPLIRQGGELGKIQGKLTFPGLDLVNLDSQRQTVQGSLQAKIQDLALVSVIAPEVQNIQGRINADFKLSGTLENPKLQGSANLLEGAADIPLAGLELRQLALQLTTPDLNRVQIRGGVHSGAGTLNLQGETRLQAKQGFPTRLQIRGTDWVALNTPEAELHIAPELTITHNRSGNYLDGEVLVPYARIRPRKLPAEAVSNSDDLVVVGAGRKPPVAKADPDFHAKLRIRFGERVSFEGFGLRAQLRGDLLVIDEPRRPVTGRGQIEIAKGTYQAYGQDLQIQRGYVLFADNPVDNPGLDISAIREAGDVTAGLRVNGTLKKPELNLFSTPTLPDGQILSYLLTGSANGNTGSQVSINAALAASGVGTLGDEVARQLGLEEFRVDTSNGLASASVVAGAYLSPRLYVQYVNELNSQETALKLRYDLMDNVQIQTESGKSQGVDLFYTLER
jgi:translocation and assembly module TamB